MMPVVKLNQQTAIGALVGLLAATLLTLGLIVWQWSADWHLTHPPQKAPPTPVSMATQMPLVSHIAKRHIFGKALKQGNLPITNLQMQITGIVKFSRNNTTASKVYLSISGQPSKIYQVGDVLPFGVKIFKITSDTVILDNDGHLEKLSLEREKLEFKKNIGLANDA